MAGDSTPVCATSGKPSTRLPLGGLGQLVPHRKSRIARKGPFWAPVILDYLTVGSATSANQATGVGPDVCTT